MRSAVILGGVLLVGALAGCLGAAPDAPGAAPEVPSSPLELALAEPVRVLGAGTNEPAVVELSDGTLFVAGSGGDSQESPILWRSVDEGNTWELVPQGGIPAGALGGGDTDLAVGPSGTLYHISIFTTSNAGQMIAVGASGDGGATWTWNRLATSPFTDRPWVDAGPDGTAYAVWSSPEGLHHARSLDRGATWEEGARVHPSGGPGGLAVGPRGEVAVRVFPLRGPFCAVVGCGYLQKDAAADGVSVSTDGGATWTFHKLPGNRSFANDFVDEFVWGDYGGDGTERWVDPVAFDADGILYAAWGEGDALLLARSTDLGATWNVLPIARAERGVVFYPFLRGGAAGELAATWYSGDCGNLCGDFEAHIAHVTKANGPSPNVRAAAFDPENPSTKGEYFQVHLLRSGSVAAAIPIEGSSPGESGFTFLRSR